jgi:branched-chain amino acid transport system permease protein
MDLFVQLFVNGIVWGSLYALVALGFGLIFSITGIFHFAHGAIFTFSAYLTYFLKFYLGLNILIASCLGTIAAGLLGGFIEIFFYRFLRRMGTGAMGLLLISLGLLILLNNLIAVVFGSEIKSLSGGVVFNHYGFGSISVTSVQIISVLVSVVLFLLVYLFLKITKIGKAMRAVKDNPEMARVVGIDYDRVVLTTFAIGSMLAAPAAILLSNQIGMNPYMGLPIMLIAAVSVIVGGLGTVIGAGPGAMIIGISENLGIFKIPSQWQTGIAFAVLLIFIVFKPSGFFGQKLRKKEV